MDSYMQDTPASHTMPFLIHKVGAGEKAAHDLTYDEALQTARLLLRGETTPAQAGGFLLALRMKGESFDEMLAFTQACREQNKPFVTDISSCPLDIPVYAGKKASLHAIVPASLLMAACGQPVVLHGFSGVPGRMGVADLLRELGEGMDTGTVEMAAARLRCTGWAYLDIADFNPPLCRFQYLRGELGVRTIFNAVSRMIDPAKSGRHLIGISHPPYFEKTLDVLRHLGSHRAIVLRGVEGGPEPSVTSDTKAYIYTSDSAPSQLTFSIEAMGVKKGHRTQIAVDDPSTHISICKQILSGEGASDRSDAFYTLRHWILWTTAFGLYAAGACPTVQDGWKTAEKALLNGQGWEKYQQLVNG